MKKKTIFIVILFVAALIVSSYYNILNINNLTGNIIAGGEQSSENAAVENNNKSPAVIFCPRENCMENFVFIANNSDINTIHCAFFDLDLQEIAEILSQKNATVIIDQLNYDSNKELFDRYNLNIIKSTNSKYMHNKFCVFDGKIVWTGSFNPTKNCNFKNNNNAVAVYSEILAENYEEEFQEMLSGVYGINTVKKKIENQKIKTPVVLLNNHTTENYFCPEDSCAEKIIKEINSAKSEIYFMAFSFTNKEIANKLIQKKNQGIAVSGVMEKSQGGQYSVFDLLVGSRIEVMWDKNPAKMHHKVFIIDNSTVITGSMNPTGSGDYGNDENLIIFHDKEIAERFLGEYNFLRQ